MADVEHAEGVKAELEPSGYAVPDDGSDVTPEGTDLPAEHLAGGRFYIPGKGESWRPA
jgi:hypothetical protein